MGDRILLRPFHTLLSSRGLAKSPGAQGFRPDHWLPTLLASTSKLPLPLSRAEPSIVMREGETGDGGLERKDLPTLVGEESSAGPTENPAYCTSSLPTVSITSFDPTSTRVTFRACLRAAAPHGGTPTSLDSCSTSRSRGPLKDSSVCLLIEAVEVFVVVGSGRISGGLQKPEG